ncbi:MAG: vitamin K epoxide reductase family protein [bacterium]
MMNSIQMINLAIALLGLCGFLLAYYIRAKKKSKKKLVCPKNPKIDCDTVIHSDYSRILGIPIEILGMLYYVLTGFAHSAEIAAYPTLLYPPALFFGVSLCAVLFSVYLIAVQAFAIRHWCLWCLGSAMICTAIAVLSYLALTLAL